MARACHLHEKKKNFIPDNADAGIHTADAGILQAAAKPGAVKLTKITAVDIITRSTSSGKNLQMLQAILYITKKLETVNGLS